MTRKYIVMLLLLTLSGAAWTGDRADVAEAGAAVDQDYQAHAIREGNPAQAETRLLSTLESDPRDPYALINLAYVYQQSGRNHEARELYQRVLELQRNPLAELPSGKPARVKRIAKRGIADIASATQQDHL